VDKWIALAVGTRAAPLLPVRPARCGIPPGPGLCKHDRCRSGHLTVSRASLVPREHSDLCCAVRLALCGNLLPHCVVQVQNRCCSGISLRVSSPPPCAQKAQGTLLGCASRNVRVRPVPCALQEQGDCCSGNLTAGEMCFCPVLRKRRERLGFVRPLRLCASRLVRDRFLPALCPASAGWLLPWALPSASDAQDYSCSEHPLLFGSALVTCFASAEAPRLCASHQFGGALVLRFANAGPLLLCANPACS
jgi:hypothetical protein